MSRNSGRTNRKAVGTLAGLGSAAAIVGAGIAAMATGSVPTAAPQPDHSDVQTATLTADSTGGTGTVDNAGFPIPPPPAPTTFLSGSKPTNTTPVIPGVTQNTALSTNNPGGGAFEFLPTIDKTGIAATPTGLTEGVSFNSALGLGNIAFSPALKISTNGDSTTVTPGGFLGLNFPGVGGGTAPVGLGINIDNNGNVTVPSLAKFFTGVANLADGTNTSNTTGFVADQPANPNPGLNTSTLFGGFGDPESQRTFNGLFAGITAAQNDQITALVNNLNVPTLQQLGLDPTSGSLLGVPGLGPAAAGNFNMFAPTDPASNNAVNSFAVTNPANPSSVGLAQGDGSNIESMFPTTFSFAPANTESGLPTFRSVLPAGTDGTTTTTPLAPIPGQSNNFNGLFQQGDTANTTTSTTTTGSADKSTVVADATPSDTQAQPPVAQPPVAQPPVAQPPVAEDPPAEDPPPAAQPMAPQPVFAAATPTFVPGTPSFGGGGTPV